MRTVDHGPQRYVAQADSRIAENVSQSCPATNLKDDNFRVRRPSVIFPQHLLMTIYCRRKSILGRQVVPLLALPPLP